MSRLGDQIGRQSSRQAASAGSDLADRTRALRSGVSKRLARSEQRLTELQHRINVVDPALLLARGWSITRTETGSVVLSPDDVARDTILETTVSGGRITSVVADDKEVRRGR